MPRRLFNIKFKRVALVDKGANLDKETGDGAHIVLYKRAEEKAELDTHTRGNLPDSAFAAVWTDAQGNKQRKLPYKHEDGSLDHAHWENALARINQTDMPSNVKAEAHKKLEAARPKEKRMTVKDLLKKLTGAMSEPDEKKRTAELAKLSKAVDGLDGHDGHDGHDGLDGLHDGGTDGLDGHTSTDIHPQHLHALKAHHAHLGKMIQHYGDGPHPDGHPVHAMKAMHAHLGKMIGACEGTDTSSHAVDGATDLHGGPMTKRIQDEVEKRIQTATATLRKQLDTEIEKRETTEMVELLKAFKHVPFDLEKDVAKFRKMKKADPEGFERIMEVFKAQEDQLNTTNLLQKNYGSPRGGSAKGSAEAQLKAKADELISKAANGMTEAQAWEKASLENPELVKRYREEQQ